jgi:hypothetical protein
VRSRSINESRSSFCDHAIPPCFLPSPSPPFLLKSCSPLPKHSHQALRIKMQQSQQAPICSGLKYTHSACIKITPASLQICFRFGGYPYGASSSRKTYLGLGLALSSIPIFCPQMSASARLQVQISSTFSKFVHTSSRQARQAPYVGLTQRFCDAPLLNV